MLDQMGQMDQMDQMGQMGHLAHLAHEPCCGRGKHRARCRITRRADAIAHAL